MMNDAVCVPTALMPITPSPARGRQFGSRSAPAGFVCSSTRGPWWPRWSSPIEISAESGFVWQLDPHVQLKKKVSLQVCQRSFYNLQRTNRITPRNHSNMKAEVSSASEMYCCIYLCGLNKIFYIGIHFNQICRVHDCTVSFQKMAAQATKTTDIRRWARSCNSSHDQQEAGEYSSTSLDLFWN